MSTLIYLPNNDFGMALRETGTRRRPGGVVEIGVWGHTQNRDWTSPDGLPMGTYRGNYPLKALGTVTRSCSSPL